MAAALSVAVDEHVWGDPLPSISAIEHELARARRAEDANALELGGSPARTAVLNLVVVASRETHAKRAADAIARLALRHPSRAVIVLTDRRGASRTGAPAPASEPPSLELRCGLSRTRVADRVCFEQILIRAHGHADALVASAVTPLLIADLPVFVWWTETPPLHSERFDTLAAMADRLVVDSADFARPDETLPRLHKALAGLPNAGPQRRCRVTDFNWTRLTPWRELVTQFFDVPLWRPSLDHVSGLRASFAVDADGREIHPSQALLMIGWLASRLGWRPAARLAPSETGGLLFELRRSDGARIPVRVRPRFERSLDEGDISSVRIQTVSDGHRAEFLVRRTADARHAVATTLTDGTVSAERTVPLPAPTIDQLLAEELSIVIRDRVYEEALGALVALA